MSCICVICEQTTDSERTCELAGYDSVFFKLTSIKISEIEHYHLLKICNICKEKLLLYDSFRTLCVKVCRKLTENTGEKCVPSPSGLKQMSEETGYEDAHGSDYELHSQIVFKLFEPLPTDPSDGVEEVMPFGEADGEEEEKSDALKEYSGLSADDNNVAPPAPRSTPREQKEITNLRQALECLLCGKKFRSALRFEGHVRVHEGLKPAVCKVCGKEFSIWRNLKKHMLNTHTDIPRTTFPCNFKGCGLSYVTRQGMRNHRKRHDPNYTTPEPKRFICELCGKTLSSTGALKKHSYIHTGNMPFHCGICGKGYPTQHKLKEHTMRHQGTRNHVCPHCGLKKTTMQELREHINCHTKEKTFACEFCEQVFLNTGNRARHVRIVHQKLKPFHCTHCNGSFAKAETLKHHVMIHTGERPHACAECGKRFIQLVALQQHLKVHTKARKDLKRKKRTSNGTEPNGVGEKGTAAHNALRSRTRQCT